MGGGLRISTVAAIIWSFSAQVLAQDYCSDVLKYAARNESLDIYESGIAKSTYDNHCSGETVKEGTNLDVGLDAVVKAVPIKFNLGHGESKERLSYFCKTFFEDYKANTARYSKNNSVVVEAVSAWQNCMTLAGEGITFRPRVSATQAHVEVVRRTAGDVKVEGVKYDDKLLQCTVSSSDKRRGVQTANLSTVKSLTADAWTVSCTRPSRMEGKETTYPKADLSIMTSRGTFLLPIPADAQTPYTFASQIQIEIDKIKSAVKTLDEQVSVRQGKAEARLAKEENEPKFGGAYTFSTISPNQWDNPITNKKDCPPNFTAHQIARYRTAEPEVGGDLYICIRHQK